MFKTVKSRLITTFVVIVLAMLISANGQSQTADKPALKVGDSVRINSLDPNKGQGMVPVFFTSAEAKSGLAKYLAEVKANKPHSWEGLVFVGHNTLATINELDSTLIEERPT